MSTAKLLFEIDGESVDADRASWYEYAPCGCCSGVILATLGGGDELLATAEQAWAHMEPNAEKRRRDQAAGCHLVLGLSSECQERLVDCTHTPKWGRKVTPIPEGYRWARQEEYRQKGRRKHLVPGEFNDNQYAHDRARKALCGAAVLTWNANWWSVNDVAECVRCQRKASAAPSSPVEGTTTTEAGQ